MSASKSANTMKCIVTGANGEFLTFNLHAVQGAVAALLTIKDEGSHRTLCSSLRLERSALQALGVAGTSDAQIAALKETIKQILQKRASELVAHKGQLDASFFLPSAQPKAQKKGKVSEDNESSVVDDSDDENTIKDEEMGDDDDDDEEVKAAMDEDEDDDDNDSLF